MCSYGIVNTASWPPDIHGDIRLGKVTGWNRELTNGEPYALIQLKPRKTFYVIEQEYVADLVVILTELLNWRLAEGEEECGIVNHALPPPDIHGDIRLGKVTGWNYEWANGEPYVLIRLKPRKKFHVPQEYVADLIVVLAGLLNHRLAADGEGDDGD